MLDALGKLRAAHPQIGDVRGREAVTAVELVEPDGAARPAPELTARVARRCHNRGLLVLTAGSYGNVLRFLPLLSITDTLLDEGLGLLGEVIAQECGTGV